jgi:hypothetical protein
MLPITVVGKRGGAVTMIFLLPANQNLINDYRIISDYRINASC